MDLYLTRLTLPRTISDSAPPMQWLLPQTEAGSQRDRIPRLLRYPRRNWCPEELYAVPEESAHSGYLAPEFEYEEYEEESADTGYLDPADEVPVYA